MEKVSVVTPSYNSSSHISETIKSVISQSYNNWEMIIVDDCSSDNSYKLACELSEQDTRIKVFQLKKNAGTTAARNKAINEAKGRYIAFLDSDDLWHPHKLEKQINFMLKNNYAFSYTAYEKINEEGKFIR